MTDQTTLKALEHWATRQGLTYEEDGYYFIGENAVKGHIKTSRDRSYIYISGYLNVSDFIEEPSTLQTALSLNLYQEKTRGGVIAFDSILNDLLLTYRLSSENVDDLTLSNSVNNLLQCSLILREAIRKEIAINPSNNQPHIPFNTMLRA